MFSGFRLPHIIYTRCVFFSGSLTPCRHSFVVSGWHLRRSVPQMDRDSHKTICKRKKKQRALFTYMRQCLSVFLSIFRTFCSVVFSFFFLLLVLCRMVRSFCFRESAGVVIQKYSWQEDMRHLKKLNRSFSVSCAAIAIEVRFAINRSCSFASTGSSRNPHNG